MSSSLPTNYFLNHDNQLLNYYNIPLSNYALENSMEWKISSYPSIHKAKPLPREPCVTKKTKPLPAVPHYYSQLHASTSTSYFSPFAGSEPLYNFEGQNATTSPRYYTPQLNSYYTLSPTVDGIPPFELDSSVNSDDSLDKNDFVFEDTSQAALEDTFSTSPQQVDDGTGRSERQIIVKSVDGEHRVWINIEPKETGESVAKKIHALATFRTQKVLTISTSSGRKIPLNKKPLFRNWEDMDGFKNGETWTYTCGPLRKSAVDNFLSKLLQV